MQDYTKQNSTVQKDRILVADDADIGRSVLRALLRKEYDVIEARNGAEVVQILRSNPGDIACILLDIMMPVMDGTKVLQFMKENDLLDKIPTIALTAISDAEGKINCYEAGAIDIIEKPYDQKMLLYKVRHTIDVFRSIRNEMMKELQSDKLEYIRGVLDALPCAVFVSDPVTDRIKYCNALFEQIPSCPNPAIGAALDSFISQSSLIRIKDSQNALVNRQVQEPAILDDLVEGQQFAAIFNALQDETGKLTDFIGTIIDARKIAETINIPCDKPSTISFGKVMFDR